jgi:ABC-type uncharacterized transport system fused permease/ATPase subunit
MTMGLDDQDYQMLGDRLSAIEEAIDNIDPISQLVAIHERLEVTNDHLERIANNYLVTNDHLERIAKALEQLKL